MSGAGCSRVTHPFAARVPRRAFPLDLHVLSTPPAFVLSQDQTLHQKLGKALSLALQRNPTTTPHTPKRRSRCHGIRGKTNALAFKHPVEFSSNNHTSRRPRLCREPPEAQPL